jgi:hypothetical protein
MTDPEPFLHRLKQTLTDACGFRTNAAAQAYAEVEALLTHLRQQ